MCGGLAFAIFGTFGALVIGLTVFLSVYIWEKIEKRKNKN